MITLQRNSWLSMLVLAAFALTIYGKTTTTGNDETVQTSELDEPQTEEITNNSSDLSQCPRYCTCSRNINGFWVANCYRLSILQYFPSHITDLEVFFESELSTIIFGTDFFKDIGLKQVSSIKIVNGIIDFFHPKAFAGLTDLYSVNFTNTKFTELDPDTFVDNKKLRILTLNDNDLSQTQMNESIHYMLKSESVEELSLVRCNLSKLLPTAFSQMKNVVYIGLAENNLETLPVNIFDGMQTLEELDLSSNKITNLPKNIFSNYSSVIAILILKSNHITGNLEFLTPDIQKLDLSFNKIVNIESTMFDQATGLTTLNLKGNGFKTIPSTAFNSLVRLRQIDLSFNDLREISASIFSKNADLDLIRLNDNYRLKSLPLDGFQSETGAFNTYLFQADNCDIRDLSNDTFKHMTHITTLDLSSNNIDSLSEGIFKPLTKLRELNLNNNLISEIDRSTFTHNSMLKKLDLANNPLANLSSNIFVPLKNLSELSLHHCILGDMWSSPNFTILENMKVLNLSFNNISHVSVEHFSAMKSLKVLDLSNNPVKCNDDFKGLMNWLKEREIKAGQSLRWELLQNHTCPKYQEIQFDDFFADDDLDGSGDSFLFSNKPVANVSENLDTSNKYDDSDYYDTKVKPIHFDHHDTPDEPSMSYTNISNFSNFSMDEYDDEFAEMHVIMSNSVKILPSIIFGMFGIIFALTM